jgi:hypothetical protein
MNVGSPSDEGSDTENIYLWRVEAAEPNQIWQTDMTKICAGLVVRWAYLRRDREIVSWKQPLRLLVRLSRSRIRLSVAPTRWKLHGTRFAYLAHAGQLNAINADIAVRHEGDAQLFRVL